MRRVNSSSNSTDTHTHVESDGVLCVSGVCGCVAALLCCLRAETPVDEGVLHAVLATLMEWRNSKEDWFLFNR